MFCYLRRDVFRMPRVPIGQDGLEAGKTSLSEPELLDGSLAGRERVRPRPALVAGLRTTLSFRRPGTTN